MLVCLVGVAARVLELCQNPDTSVLLMCWDTGLAPSTLQPSSGRPAKLTSQPFCKDVCNCTTFMMAGFELKPWWRRAGEQGAGCKFVG